MPGTSQLKTCPLKALPTPVPKGHFQQTQLNMVDGLAPGSFKTDLLYFPTLLRQAEEVQSELVTVCCYTLICHRFPFPVQHYSQLHVLVRPGSHPKTRREIRGSVSHFTSLQKGESLFFSTLHIRLILIFFRSPPINDSLNS